MDLNEHFHVTGSALKHWAMAQAQDSLAVGLMWTVGLSIIHVPWPFLWGFLAAVLQIVPHFGPVLGMVGPVVAAVLEWRDWRHPLYVLILYAIIVVVDSLLLQPYLMKRAAKVPIWASILFPIILGIVWPFWGIFVAPPLLAVVYAYKARTRASL